MDVVDELVHHDQIVEHDDLGCDSRAQAFDSVSIPPAWSVRQVPTNPTHSSRVPTSARTYRRHARWSGRSFHTRTSRTWIAAGVWACVTTVAWSSVEAVGQPRSPKVGLEVEVTRDSCTPPARSRPASSGMFHTRSHVDDSTHHSSL
eukprot:scaffold585_cov330-Pavlova_lutheri.AAC.21